MYIYISCRVRWRVLMRSANSNATHGALLSTPWYDPRMNHNQPTYAHGGGWVVWLYGCGCGCGVRARSHVYLCMLMISSA